ncbi:TM2 domain-containing protein [Actinoplanes sp. NBC_00393]|uniref:TM2 domain-containing protein n=1 Tax=Actinoplanes sp. NBC_00393 TaxID=2975953 RepID=UPI002E24E6AD
MSQPHAPHPQGHFAHSPAPVQVVLPRPLKETWIAYLLLLFLGGLGIHQFYLGKTGRGLLTLFTIGGFFGILLIVDLFTLPSQTRTVNAQIATGVA